MEVKKIGLEFTEDEVSLLVMALEVYLVEQMKTSKSFKSFETLEEDTLDLLHSFLYIDGPIFIYKKGLFKSTEYTDAYKWARAKYKQVKDEN